MNNMICLVGRLVSDPEINETKNGNKVTNITLAVPRSYKNEEGIYETDFIPVRLWKGIAESTTEWCHKGDLIGVKGRLARLSCEDLTIVAEKISFLASNNKNDQFI